MRELNEAEIDAVSGGEIGGCKLPGTTLGGYMDFAVRAIITGIRELFSPRDPWA